MIFVFFLVVVTILLLIIAIKQDADIDDATGGGSLVACALLGASLLIWTGCYFNSLSSYRDLRCYEKNLQMAVECIEKTSGAVIDLRRGELINVAPSVENLAHSTIMANRIAEVTNYQIKMNKVVEWYRIVNDSWFLRQWVAKTPDDIKEMWVRK